VVLVYAYTNPFVVENPEDAVERREGIILIQLWQHVKITPRIAKAATISDKGTITCYSILLNKELLW